MVIFHSFLYVYQRVNVPYVLFHSAPGARGHQLQLGEPELTFYAISDVHVELKVKRHLGRWEISDGCYTYDSWSHEHEYDYIWLYLIDYILSCDCILLHMIIYYYYCIALDLLLLLVSLVLLLSFQCFLERGVATFWGCRLGGPELFRSLLKLDGTILVLQ